MHKITGSYAAGWKILSCTCFAMISGIVHYLSSNLPPLELAFFQTGSGALFFCIFWKFHTKKWLCLSSSQLLPSLGRALCVASGTGLWFICLKYLPLGVVASFKLISPLSVVLASYLFLQEPLGKNRMIALALSMGGTLFLYVKEFFGGAYAVPGWFILCPLLTVFCFTASHLLAKYLLRKTSPAEATFSLLILTMLFLTPPALFQWITPSLSQAGWIILMGILSGIAYYALNHSLHLADLTYLIPFSFFRFVVSVSIGWAVFHEPFTLSIAMGIVLIMGGNLWLVYTEKAKS